MQEHPSSASQVLLDALKILVVPLAAAIGYLGSWIQNRKKTGAEARKLDGETIDRAYNRIDELVAVNYQLRQDCLALQKKVDMAELREKMYDEGRRQTKARLVLQETKDGEVESPPFKQDSP